jgi:hypothetical protein
MGITVLSGYFVFKIQLTTVPAGAGKPAALSVTFHPSTNSFVSSANLRNFRVGTNSCNIFNAKSSRLKRERIDIKISFALENFTAFFRLFIIIVLSSFDDFLVERIL